MFHGIDEDFPAVVGTDTKGVLNIIDLGRNVAVYVYLGSDREGILDPILECLEDGVLHISCYSSAIVNCNRNLSTMKNTQDLLRAAKMLEGIMLSKNLMPSAPNLVDVHKRRLSALIFPGTPSEKASKMAHMASLKAYTSGNPQDHAEALKLHHVAAAMAGGAGDRQTMLNHRQHVIEHSQAANPGRR